MASYENLCKSAYQLQKDHFKVTQDGRHIRLVHPAFGGRSGFVIFYLVGCPECQDTKVEWTATALKFAKNKILPTGFVNTAKCPGLRKNLGILEYPSIKFIRKDGILVDYHGPITFESLDYFFEKCKSQMIL